MPFQVRVNPAARRTEKRGNQFRGVHDLCSGDMERTDMGGRRATSVDCWAKAQRGHAAACPGFPNLTPPVVGHSRGCRHCQNQFDRLHRRPTGRISGCDKDRVPLLPGPRRQKPTPATHTSKACEALGRAGQQSRRDDQYLQNDPYNTVQIQNNLTSFVRESPSARLYQRCDIVVSFAQPGYHWGGNMW